MMNNLLDPFIQRKKEEIAMGIGTAADYDGEVNCSVQTLLSLIEKTYFDLQIELAKEKKLVRVRPGDIISYMESKRPLVLAGGSGDPATTYYDQAIDDLKEHFETLKGQL